MGYGRRPRRGLLKALAWEPLFRANSPGLHPMKEPHTVTDMESHFLHALPLPAKGPHYLSHAAWAMLLSVSPVREENVAGS